MRTGYRRGRVTTRRDVAREPNRPMSAESCLPPPSPLALAYSTRYRPQTESDRHTESPRLSVVPWVTGPEWRSEVNTPDYVVSRAIGALVRRLR